MAYHDDQSLKFHGLVLVQDPCSTRITIQQEPRSSGPAAWMEPPIGMFHIAFCAIFDANFIACGVYSPSFHRSAAVDSLLISLLSEVRPTSNR